VKVIRFQFTKLLNYQIYEEPGRKRLASGSTGKASGENEGSGISQKDL